MLALAFKYLLTHIQCATICNGNNFGPKKRIRPINYVFIRISDEFYTGFDAIKEQMVCVLHKLIHVRTYAVLYAILHSPLLSKVN